MTVSKTAIDAASYRRLLDWRESRPGVGRIRVMWLGQAQMYYVMTRFEGESSIGIGATILDALADARRCHPELCGGDA